MIVCHVIIGLNIGGAELMLKRLIDYFNTHEQTTRHVVISLTTIGPIGLSLKTAGIEVYCIGFGSKKHWTAVWHLYKTIRLIKPDIIQTWMYHSDLVGGVIGRLAGCKNVIWGIRATEIYNQRTIKIRFLCAQLSRWLPNVIVCVAKVSYKTHVKLGYFEKKMVVIPNGFELQTLTASPEEKLSLRASCGIKTSDIVIGILGRFDRDKDHNNFVQAARLLAVQMKSVRFLMVGRNLDDKNDELIGWISETGFADRFVLLGERRDVPACLAAMDVFCLSSITEGFPNVLGEAMAMRKLCVATDAGDAAFLLGDCGVIVPCNNSQALSNGVLSLLNLSPNEQIALGERAHNRIVAEFAMKQSMALFSNLYSRLLENGTSRAVI